MKDYSKLVDIDGDVVILKATGEPLASPTKILYPITSHQYRKVPGHIMEQARLTGENIDQAISNWETMGEKTLTIPKEIAIFNQYLKWKKDHKVKIQSLQTMIVNESNLFYGYVDIICKVGGVLSCIEVKTRSVKGRKVNGKGKSIPKLSDLMQATMYKMTLDIPTYLLELCKDQDNYIFSKVELHKEHMEVVKHLCNLNKAIIKGKLYGGVYNA